MSEELSKEEEDALWVAYSEAKEILRAISMNRSSVLSKDELKKKLREHVEFLNYCLDELDAPVMRPYDNVGDILEWVFKRRVLYGALKQTIDAHGPITHLWIGSAVKRIKGKIQSRILVYRKVNERIKRNK